jgi:folate-binding protein YgfZ
MPFKGFIAGEPARVESTMQILEQKGARAGDEADLAAARVLAGWPSLGREIDEKTLPQEVRYDELGAVSYSKGCYTGQETVARVHFRGHPNRVLRAVALPAADIPADRTITMQGKEVGVLRTTVRTDDRTIALATLRREVPEDAKLQINELGAQIIALPVAEGVTA